ncbi:hypothetical protein [Nesterenkonia sp. F]|uniref:hypothetical protein n=1 Tax=Nesterenkonia sp. F TaxID=795955 RepID=UPI000255CB55|nr:hypothetical protein [Nesterenkonia sp. F]
MPELPWGWGPRPSAESLAVLPRSPQDRLVTRAVVSTAAPDTLFLWVCQLRRAPYSYDWIDNVGRRSPRRPDPRCRELTLGQTFMSIFTLVDMVPDRSVTLRMKPGAPTTLFGTITLVYRIEPQVDGRSRLVAMMAVPPIGRRAADRLIPIGGVGVGV